MIIKKNFNPLRVISYIKSELVVATTLSLIVYFLHRHGFLNFSIPFPVTAILGSALAIFIGFRNNSSYARWWEARTLWGSIINANRVFARLVITFTDSHASQPNYSAERAATFKKEMLYLGIAWSHALRIHLRKEDSWVALQPFLSSQEYLMVSQAQNKPNVLHMLMGQKIYKAMQEGTLAGFDSFQIEGQLLALANAQGGCERIKNTPMLRQYDYFTRVFLYTFIVVLPFTLIADFTKMEMPWLTIPLSIIISVVFAIIGKVGAVNEDPFENRITDVPLTSMCITIERDLREMLGEKELPPAATSVDGYIY